jgi:hypothetical protein
MNYNRCYQQWNGGDDRSVNNNYRNKIKTLDLYNIYKNYHLHNEKYNKRYDKNKMNESLWFNVKTGGDLIHITGNYCIERTQYGYYYTPNTTLYLNNISVKYINLSVHNTHNSRDICIKLNFVYNLTTYCNMIDYVLVCYYRRFKYILFSYLPIEIIEYILYLSSIC